jgi:hypothetical protein
MPNPLQVGAERDVYFRHDEKRENEKYEHDVEHKKSPISSLREGYQCGTNPNRR